MTTQLVLASASPSRLRLLRNAGIDPLVQPSEVDEEAVLATLGAEAQRDAVVAELARAKTEDVAHRHSARLLAETGASRLLLVGCDSMLLANGELVGKPYTEARAWDRWDELRGRSATLITGHHLIEVLPGEDSQQPSQQRSASDTSRTEVHFGTPADRDVRAYISTGEPLECAGAFTLEALGGWFIDAIEGDPSGVIGLSLPLLRRLLEQLDVAVSELWRPALISTQ